MSATAHVTRTDPPIHGDERETLLAFLNYHRDTFRLKCEGLTPDQMLARATPPSTLSLLGILRHLADVEQGWFNHHFEGNPAQYYHDYSQDDDAEFNVFEADEASVAQAWADYDTQIALSDAVIAAHDLAEIAAGTRKNGEQMSLRWILVHLIEEYARHNGHTDLLREAIDGSTGE